MINSGLLCKKWCPDLENARNEIKSLYGGRYNAVEAQRLGLVRQSVGTILQYKPILKTS